MSRAVEILVRGSARVVLGLFGHSGSVPATMARRWALRRLLGSCGSDLHVGPGIDVIGPRAIRLGDRFRSMRGAMLYASGAGKIVVGDNCSINTNVQIDSGPQGVIRIGDDVLIGTNVVLRNCDHRWRDATRPIQQQGHSCADIEVGDDVWIAANSVVLGGAQLHNGCVVAAGSVVRRGAYGPGALVAGNPATVIGTRGNDEPLPAAELASPGD